MMVMNGYKEALLSILEYIYPFQGIVLDGP